MFEVSVVERFRASHHIRYPNGEWEAAHDHDWNVEVRYRATQLDANDLVVDFVEVQGQLREVLASLEATDLNTNPLVKSGNPTAERVAEWIFLTLIAKGGPQSRLWAVIVEEAPGCRATYARD